MLIRWKELIVPGIVFFFAIYYGLQVKGQTRAVVMIPYGVIVLLLGLIAVVIWREAIVKDKVRAGSGEQISSTHRAYSLKERAVGWVLGYKRELGLTFLSIGYYVGFEIIGFTLDNVIFLMLSFSILGLNWKRSVIYTFFTAIAIYLSASLMQLNVPAAPWFR